MPSDVHLGFKSRAGRSLVSQPAENRESFKEMLNEEVDESQDDAAATGGTSAFNMNQSIFQMITVAGSKTNFNKQYESSDSEDVDHDDGNGVPHNVLRSVAILKKPSRSKNYDKRMLQSTPHLRTLKSRLEPFAEQDDIDGDDDAENKTAGPSSPNRIPISTETSALQPHLLSAALGASMAKNEAAVLTYDMEEKEAEADLATKLMEIFGFSEAETVISGIYCLVFL